MVEIKQLFKAKAPDNFNELHALALNAAQTVS